MLPQNSSFSKLTDKLRTGKEFLGDFDTRKFSVPKSFEHWQDRFLNNISYYKINYLFVFFLIGIFRCIWEPKYAIPLIGAIVGFIFLAQKEGKEVYDLIKIDQVKGIKLLAFQIMIASLAIGFILALIIGSISDLIFTVWSSTVLILLHGSFRDNNLRKKFQSFLQSLTDDLPNLEAVEQKTTEYIKKKLE